MARSPLTILTVDTTTRFLLANDIFNSVYRQLLGDLRHYPVAIIPDRHIRDGVALFYPIFVHIVSYYAIYRSNYIRPMLCVFHSPTTRRRARHVIHSYSATPHVRLNIGPLSNAVHKPPFSHSTQLSSSLSMSVPRSFLHYPLHCDRPPCYLLLLFLPSLFVVVTSGEQYQRALPSEDGTHQNFL